MARNGALFDLVALETGGNEVLAQPSGIKPFLERRNRSIVAEQTAVPDTSKRRDFIEAGPFAGLER